MQLPFSLGKDRAMFANKASTYKVAIMIIVCTVVLMSIQYRYVVTSDATPSNDDSGIENTDQYPYLVRSANVSSTSESTPAKSNDNEISKGYLFAANTDVFLMDAVRSAISLKKVDSVNKISIILDDALNESRVYQLIRDSEICPFDNFAFLPKPDKPTNGYIFKLYAMLASPYQSTLFLDGDTCICRPIDDLFNLAYFADISAAYSPTQHPNPKVDKEFREINTGVVLYNSSSPIIRKIFEETIVYYENNLKAFIGHQQPLREIMQNYIGNYSWLLLPHHYHCRFAAECNSLEAQNHGYPCRLIHSRGVCGRDNPVNLTSLGFHEK